MRRPENGFGSAITDIELSPHKYLLHADRLRTLAQDGDVYPVTVELDPVNYCNHRCGWCVDPAHGHSRLDEDFARELLGELRELGVMGIVYKGGGEPTLHPSLQELLEFTRGLGYETGLVTNGSRLEKVVRPVVSHASYLRVSIDGPTPQSHTAVHGSDDFQDIIAGVKKAVRTRDECGQRHPVIGLSFAMDYGMIHLVGEAVELGDCLGVDYVLFRTPFFGEVGREPTMTIEQAQTVRDAFDAARDAYCGEMRIMVDHWISDREASEISGPGSSSPRRGLYQQPGANGIEHVTGRCLASPLLAVVAGDRSVYPCCNLRTLEEWRIGVVDYEADRTFRQIWEGKRRREVMERIHRTECIRYCTHPMSKYNEAIEYLAGPKHHGGFV